MITITKEQAVCMLYCKPYDKDRAIELLKYIEHRELQICYSNDPIQPILMSSAGIRKYGSIYKQYPALYKDSN